METKSLERKLMDQQNRMRTALNKSLGKFVCLDDMSTILIRCAMMFPGSRDSAALPLAKNKSCDRYPSLFGSEISEMELLT